MTWFLIAWAIVAMFTAGHAIVQKKMNDILGVVIACVMSFLVWPMYWGQYAARRWK
ncbi:hypothetical protein [Roseibium algicola]|uniref:hypothetical protein n=1 Tax=Roseibium algicola TaxID=2857014 RepID=UPI0012EB7E10|nr:hypothetical protein [Roseibium aggregatum]